MSGQYQSPARFEDLTIIAPKALGATLLSTVVLRQLRRKHPKRIIRCVAQFTDLLQESPHINEILSRDDINTFSRAIQDKEVIDLSGTLDFQPNRRAQPVHLIDLLCSRAGVENDGQGPECFLRLEEMDEAARLVRSRRKNGRAVIAIATRTSTRNKEWPDEKWNQLVARLGTAACLLHLGEPRETPLHNVEYLSVTPRRCIAITKYVDGVITPDTFLLHAAATQRLKAGGVITLLGSSHPDCVSYATFSNLYFKEYDCQPCGRPYNPFDLALLPDGEVDRWPNGKPKKWECSHVACMDLVNVEAALEAVQRSIIMKSIRR